MAWEVKERRVGSVTVLDLSGRMTLGEASDALEQKLQSLIAGDCRALLLNFEGVAAIDSRGLKALVRGFTSMQRRDGQFRLMKLQPRVKEVLNVTYLLSVIEAFDDEETALGSFT